MKIVLRSDVDNIGKRGDIVDVADGHARNLLIPSGQAIEATPGIQAQADRMRKKRDTADAKDREVAESVARTLVPAVISIKAKAGAEGKLFGSVTTTDIADAVEAQTGIVLDRRHVHLDEPIRTTGEHTATARLHSEVEFPITVDVVAK